MKKQKAFFSKEGKSYCYWGIVAGGAELGGPRGPVPPHLFWIYVVKISKFCRFRMKFFFYLVVPPIKNLLPSTLHPDKYLFTNR